MRTIQQIEALVTASRLTECEAINYIIENELENQLSEIEDYCEVTSSTRGQNVNYGDFTSSGEIINWSNERRNFYRNAKLNENGELEVKIFHSDVIVFEKGHFIKVNLFDTLLESNL